MTTRNEASVQLGEKNGAMDGVATRGLGHRV